MPILHTQIIARTNNPDGTHRNLPPSVGLVRLGPCVQVSISVSQAIAEQLLQQGLPVPGPLSGIGLIDTGASVTCIDDAAAQELHLPAIDVATIASASHPATQQNVYPVHIELLGTPMSIDAPRAIGAALGAQSLLVLIGRDVLQNCTLFYNGASGEITLSM